MEHQKAVVPFSSSPPPPPPPAADCDRHFSDDPDESLFSSLLHDMSQKVQSTMENMLKMTREVDQSTSEITREIGKCREFGAVRRKGLEEEKSRMEKAAFAILELLHARGGDH